ncbi:MAG: DUF3638 domain-containing protein, partial [Puniceicoccales bacterium]|nr:DUF3638 domain-containing protein [Puniceicoccales bacterium]
GDDDALHFYSPFGVELAFGECTLFQGTSAYLVSLSSDDSVDECVRIGSSFSPTIRSFKKDATDGLTYEYVSGKKTGRYLLPNEVMAKFLPFDVSSGNFLCMADSTSKKVVVWRDGQACSITFDLEKMTLEGNCRSFFTGDLQFKINADEPQSVMERKLNFLHQMLSKIDADGRRDEDTVSLSSETRSKIVEGLDEVVRSGAFAIANEAVKTMASKCFVKLFESRRDNDATVGKQNAFLLGHLPGAMEVSTGHDTEVRDVLVGNAKAARLLQDKFCDIADVLYATLLADASGRDPADRAEFIAELTSLSRTMCEVELTDVDVRLAKHWRRDKYQLLTCCDEAATKKLKEKWDSRLYRAAKLQTMLKFNLFNVMPLKGKSTLRNRMADAAPRISVKIGASAEAGQLRESSMVSSETSARSTDTNFANVGMRPLKIILGMGLGDMFDFSDGATQPHDVETTGDTVLDAYRRTVNGEFIRNGDIFWPKVDAALAEGGDIGGLCHRCDSAVAVIGEEVQIIEQVLVEEVKAINAILHGNVSDAVKMQRTAGGLQRPTIDALVELLLLSRADDDSGVDAKKFYEEYKLRYDNSLTSSAQIEPLISEMHNYLIVKTSLDYAKRIASQIADLDSKVHGLADAGTSAAGALQMRMAIRESFGQLVTAISSGRCYDPEKELFILHFEYVTGFRLKLKQVETLRKVLGRMESPNEEDRSVLFQLMMGGGKTSVILSLLAKILAGRGKIVVCANHSSQHSTMSEDLRAYQRSRYNQTLHRIDYEIGDVKHMEVVKRIRDELLAAVKDRGVVSIQSTTLRALHIMRAKLTVERYTKMIDSADDRKLDVINEIAKILHDNCLMMCDEADINLNPAMSVNLPIGKKVDFTAEHKRVFADFFSVIAENRDLIAAVGSGNGLDAAQLRRIVEGSFVKLGLPFDGTTNPTLDAAVAFVLRNVAPSDPPTPFEAGIGTQMGAPNFEKVCLVCGLVETLCYVSKKKFCEHFGFRKTPIAAGKFSVQVVPYTAANTPSTGEYANPMEVVVFGNIAHILSIGARADSLPGSAIYCELDEFITKTAGNITSPQFAMLSAKFPEHAARIIDATSRSSKAELDVAIKALCDAAFAEFVTDGKDATWCFARLLEWKYMHNNATYRGSSYAQMLAFTMNIAATGTPSNIDLLGPMANPGAQVLEAGVSSRVELKVYSDLKSKDSVLFHVPKIAKPNNPSIVSAVLEARDAEIAKTPSSPKGNFSAIMDAAGLFKALKNRDVAMQIAEHLDSIGDRGRGVLFFEDGAWKVLLSGGAVVCVPNLTEGAIQAATGLRKERLFVLFDQAHCIGIDTKLAIDARAMLTVSATHTPNSLFLQAVLRERQFFSGQKVDICMVEQQDDPQLPPCEEFISFIQRSREIERSAVAAQRYQALKMQYLDNIIKQIFDRISHLEGVLKQQGMFAALRRRRILKLLKLYAESLEKMTTIKHEFNCVAWYGQCAREVPALEDFTSYANGLGSLTAGLSGLDREFAAGVERFRKRFFTQNAQTFENIGAVMVGGAEQERGMEVQSETETETETQAETQAEAQTEAIFAGIEAQRAALAAMAKDADCVVEPKLSQAVTLTASDRDFAAKIVERNAFPIARSLGLGSFRAVKLIVGAIAGYSVDELIGEIERAGSCIPPDVMAGIRGAVESSIEHGDVLALDFKKSKFFEILRQAGEKFRHVDRAASTRLLRESPPKTGTFDEFLVHFASSWADIDSCRSKLTTGAFKKFYDAKDKSEISEHLFKNVVVAFAAQCDSARRFVDVCDVLEQLFDETKVPKV